MTRRLLLIVAIVAGALAFGACAADEARQATTDLAVTGTDDLRFDPDEFTVPVGEQVTLTLTSEEGAEHDFVIEDAADVGMIADDDDVHGPHDPDPHGDHADEDDLHVAHADPGETVTATFMLDEPGTYTVYCSVPGHREAGMVATLTVVEADAD